MAEQSEAAKRAAARKAKILARGNSGLNKLAQTARGDEAEKLYGNSGTSTPTPTLQQEDGSSSTQAASPSTSVPPPRSASSAASGSAPQPRGNTQASSDQQQQQQQMAAQLQAMMSMLGGGPGAAGGPGGDGAAPDFASMFSQMLGAGGPLGGPGLGDGQNRLLGNGMGMGMGDMDDPAGLGGMPPGFPDFSALGGFGGGGGGPDGMPSFPGFPGMGGLGAPAKKSWIERIFPLLHTLSIIVLVGFVVVWWEPRLSSLRGGLERTWVSRWSGLGGRKGRSVLEGVASGVLGGVEVLPVFWAFTTLELILQTTRFMILKSPPPPHSLLSNFLPLLPPNISRPLLTASRYLSLLNQTWKDACLLVFGVGMVVVLAECLG